MTYRQFGSRLEGHPTPVLPWVDVATGSLGQGLPIGVGMALAGKKLDRLPFRVWVLCGDSEMAEGSMWEAAEHAALRGARQPHRDRRRQPARPARPDGWAGTSTSTPAACEAFGWHAIEVDGHDVEAIDAAYSEAARPWGGRPRSSRARSRARASSTVEDQDGWHGKPLAERGGGHRGARRRAQRSGSRCRSPTRRRRTAFETGAAECRAYELGSKVATRKAYGEALAGARRRRAATSSRSTARSSNSTFAEIFAQGAPERYFEMYIAEQQMVAAAVGMQVARVEAVRVDLRGVPIPRLRLRPHGRGLAARRSSSAARTPASRSARTARRRWRSRTSPRCGRVTASTVLYPCDGNQTAALVAAMADLRRDLVPAHDAGRHAGALRAGRGVPGRRLRARVREGDDVALSAPGSRCTRR